VAIVHALVTAIAMCFPLVQVEITVFVSSNPVQISTSKMHNSIFHFNSTLQKIPLDFPFRICAQILFHCSSEIELSDGGNLLDLVTYSKIRNGSFVFTRTASVTISPRSTSGFSSRRRWRCSGHRSHLFCFRQCQASN
jgi:hypothetical protein